MVPDSYETAQSLTSLGVIISGRVTSSSFSLRGVEQILTPAHGPQMLFVTTDGNYQM